MVQQIQLSEVLTLRFHLVILTQKILQSKKKLNVNLTNILLRIQLTLKVQTLCQVLITNY